MPLEIGVRDIVETVFPSGDLQSAFLMRQLAEAGTNAHAKVRASRPDGYLSEVAVSRLVDAPDFPLRINGRIDGVLRAGAAVTIEEIKATLRPVSEITGPLRKAHLAQAKMYAFMYCAEHSQDRAEISLTYYSLPDAAVKTFSQSSDMAELSSFFHEVVGSFWELLRWDRARIADRDRSCASLPFPFRMLRRGQQELMQAVEEAIVGSSRLFARAATGIGKTMSVLFPSVRALAEGKAARIFYLTARGTARVLAERSMDLLRDGGARLRSVTITAKEQACLLSRTRCDTGDCPYAQGYYDRVGEALRAARSDGAFTAEAIKTLAHRFSLCPFELSLDLSLSADCIICDYNYLFDPHVSLKRFFAEPRRDSVFLIDEAHNLIERVRSIHSAVLSRKAVLAARRLFVGSGFKEASRDLKAVGDLLASIKKGLAEEGLRLKAAEDRPRELVELVERARESLGRALSGDRSPELLDFHDSLLDFLHAGQSYGETHATIADCTGRDVAVTLLCLDPSGFIREALDKGRASVCFSATLGPRAYFVPALGGDTDDPFIDIPSPFPPENFLVMIDANVSTRFHQRESTLSRVAQSLVAFTQPRGNYIAFFPSYAYMAGALRVFRALAPGVRTVVQEKDMSREAREAFLAGFSASPEETLVGFAVLGGIFGEGIDLMGDRLSGVAIAGVGLPAVSPERELMRGRDGFEGAYAFPGLTRVLQAAGRVIRSETDRGAVLLLDDRYARPFYREHLPREWTSVQWVDGPEEITDRVSELALSGP
jgi:DNA excision repair protein ERCC-2